MAKFKEKDIVMINEYWTGNESYLGLIGEVVKIRGRFYMIKVKHYGYKFRLLVDPEEITKLGTTLPEIRFRYNKFLLLTEFSINGFLCGTWLNSDILKRVFVCGEYVGEAKSKADIKRRLKKKTKRIQYWTLEE